MNQKKLALLSLTALLAAALAARSVFAAGNPDPVRHQVDQFKWLYPQWFNQTVYLESLDAGPSKVQSLRVASDAGVAGHLGVAGFITGPVIDAGWLGAGSCTLGGGIGTCPVLDAGFITGGNVVAGTRVTTPVLDAGWGFVGGCTMGGSIGTCPVLDAGFIAAGKVAMGGTYAAVTNPNDGGSPEPRCIYGREVLAANAAIVAFVPAFGIAPACTCSHEAASPIGCGPTAAATTTAVTFGVPAGAGTVSWVCCGGR